MMPYLISFYPLRKKILLSSNWIEPRGLRWEVKNQEQLSVGLGYAHGFFRTFHISSLALCIIQFAFQTQH